MKNTLIIIGLLFSVGTNAQVLLGSIDNSDWISNEPQEKITKVEAIKDTLYVYKEITPNSSISCAAYHGVGEICDWNNPYNVRDIYAIKEGVMTLIKTQSPTIKKVDKKVYEYIEEWE